MNAPSTTDHLADPVLELLPCAALAPSETHVQERRRRRYSVTGLDEMAESIRANGVLQPLLVRPLEAMRGLAKYELVAGERRWLGAKIAELAHVPCMVREMSDGQVLEAQLIENLQREGVHELDEAEGYRELMDLKHATAAQIADTVGKSRRHVFNRLKLLQLPAEASAALERGDLDVSRAQLVAGVQPEKLQAKALKLAMERGYGDNKFRWSVRDLAEQLAQKRFTVGLRAAPFALDEPLAETLTSKTIRTINPFPGPCSECPNRIGNALEPDACGANVEVCTHVACFDYRVQLYGARRAVEAKASGATVISGEEAAKIFPDKKHVVGYVDLDAVCETDRYPGPEPEYIDTGNEEADDAANEAVQAAWDERASAYQPRTYRQILAGAGLDKVLAEDPHSKRVRELVDAKAARALLKERSVNFYSDLGAPPPQPAKRGPTVDHATQHAKWEADRKAKEERDRRALEFRRRLMAEIWPQIKGPASRADLVAIAELTMDKEERAWNVVEGVKLTAKELLRPGNLKEADLQRLLILLPVAACLAAAYVNTDRLLGLAKRYKVDVAKIKREFDATVAAKNAAKKPKPATPKAKTKLGKAARAKAKKKGAKK